MFGFKVKYAVHSDIFRQISNDVCELTLQPGHQQLGFWTQSVATHLPSNHESCSLEHLMTVSPSRTLLSSCLSTLWARELVWPFFFRWWLWC